MKFAPLILSGALLAVPLGSPAEEPAHWRPDGTPGEAPRRHVHLHTSAAGYLESAWPTLRRDSQRSGYTAEFIPGPYERKWFRDFHDEMIATRVEAIVADGRCFVGTFAGKFHALNVEDGSTAWSFQAGGPIGHSACYLDGRIYFGSDDGYLYCLRAADGELLWRYQAGAGIWVAPATDGDRIYFGDRAGVFHAVGIKTGRAAWTFESGGMVLTPASLSEEGGKVVFGAEDMHVYCLSPEGELLWKSRKLGGLSLRDHAPVIWRGLVLVQTNPAIGFHQAAGQSPAVMTAAQKALPMEPEDKVIFDQWGSFAMRLTPRRLEVERKAILEFLAGNPHEQVFYAFQLEDGREPWTAPVLYTGGLHNPSTPPTFNPRTGDLYLWMPSALSIYSAGVPGGAISVAKLDRETGLGDIIWHRNGERLGWAFDFAAPADETQSLSLMGSILLNTHQGIIGGLNLDTLKWHKVYIARDTYGGIFGPAVVPGSFKGAVKAHREGRLALMANEWHGPDRSVAAIAENRMFWVAGSQVVCLGGPDVPRGVGGGAAAPGPIQRKVMPVVPAGNVAANGVGDFNAALPKKVFQADDLRSYLDVGRTVAHSETAPAARLRAELDRAVLELIEGAPWAPFLVQLGLSGVEVHFQRPSETMQIVALAWPHLSPPAAGQAREFLESLFAGGVPLSQPSFAQGRRREFHTPGPQMKEAATRVSIAPVNVADLYALWAYAHYLDAWEAVLAERETIQDIFHRFLQEPFAFDHDDSENDAAEHLNGRIAGTLSYARIMRRANQPGEVRAALEHLALLLTERVHHERADSRFVRSTRVAQYKLHQAKIPRYVGLTPELGRFLRDHAGPELQKNLEALTAQLPVWHHAFGERLIGGENYISPPHLARGLFAALAFGGVAEPAELAARLDHPWCRADLYRVEKLAGLLRVLDEAEN